MRTLASLLLLGIFAGSPAALATGPAHAEDQDEERYVDLAARMVGEDGPRSGASLDLLVANLGNLTAYDVEVILTRTRHTQSLWTLSLFPPGASAIRQPQNTVLLPQETFGAGFALNILEIPAHTEYRLVLGGGLAGSQNTVFDFSATIAANGSYESESRLANNSTTVWQNLSSQTSRPAKPDYSVAVSVDDRHPTPGDTVNFTVRAEALSGSGGEQYIAEGCVNIKMTDGLTAGTATFDPTTDRSFTTSTTRECGDTSGADGFFLLPDVHSDADASAMTLPVTIDSNATVDEQCLTAEIFALPPTGVGEFRDNPHDNRVEVCIDDPPPEVFDEGEVRTWTLFACKEGVADNACDTADEVDVRVVASVLVEEGELSNPDVIRVLDNATALIHVKDVPGRVFDDDNNGSVTNGTTVSWQTATDEVEDFTGTRDGAKPGIYREPVNDYISNWTNYHPTVKATGVDGGNPPGNLSVRTSWNGTPFWTLTSTNSWSFKRESAFNLDNASTTVTILMFEFETLGTYVVDFDVDMKHATIDDDNNNDTDVFSGTGRTIFHVGPIAELGVGDGGPSADVGTDQVAFTVAGFNDSGETYESGKIVVELPDGTSALATIPAGTGVFDGTASPPTWTWDIHDLEQTGDRRRSNGLPAGEIVTLIVEGVSAGETAMAEIIYGPYEVCVASDGSTATATTETACDAISGASWHEGTVFDYNDGNDTATLTARAGGNVPGTPTVKTPLVYMPAVGFEWDEIQYLYGTPVKHYETEWSVDGVTGWGPLTDEVLGIEDLDTDIGPGETRYYRVRAVNQAGVPGPWSAPISAMAGQQATAGAPDAPVLTGVPNEPNGRTEILITWTKPVENGSSITSYTLQVSDNGRDPWSDVSPQPSAAAESYVYSDGLTGGTRKYFRMLATNGRGDSLWSDVVNTTTRAPGISSAPVNVSAVADGDSAIDVSWDAPLDDGGADITRYEVQWSADGSTGWRTAGSTTDGMTLTYKNTGMTFGTTRYYRVAARNNQGVSAWSDPPYASATTLAGVPGQPGLTVRATDANTIALTWTVPADNGDAITRYQIQWSLDGTADSWNSLSRPGAADTSHNDSNLDPGTQRYYRIRAVNNTGDGSWSVVRNATTPPAVPGAPTLRAAANGENAIDLTWDPPADDGGAAISGYELHVSTDGGANYSRLTSPSASTRSSTHSGLQPGDQRYYQLRARNSAGWGPLSQPVSANTLTGVPATPGLTARANGATEIKLTWTKPDDRGSDITGYRLEVSDDGNAWNSLAPGISASDSEYVHAGLSGGTTQYYRIRAVNGNGDGQWSATRSARTDAGGPDAPEELTATPNGDTQIDLSWTVPADNGSSIRGYWVERSRDGNAPWERLTSSNRATTYSDTDLYRGMTRYYRVAAYNGAGAGLFSNVASATTTGDPATAPEAPTLVRLSNVARGEVTLAWAAPANDGGAPVSGYEYRYRVGVPCGTGSVCFTDSDVTATTGTSGRITGLSDAGLYLFYVRAENPIGRGEWGSARATLAPSSNAAVRVSPSSFAVDEGDSFSYTIRLATEPPHPVVLYTTTRSGANHISGDHLSRYLVPDNWNHPDPNRDWNVPTFEWDEGVTVTRTANEDGDTMDGSAVVDIWVEQPDYNTYKPCDHITSDTEKDQCEQDWEDDWAGSPYLKLSGPSVAVTITDND